MNRVCLIKFGNLLSGLIFKRSAGGMFRAKRGLPAKNNEWGPLTDLPDYSFIDGRIPKTTSIGQRRRLVENYEATKQIMQLSSELINSQRKLEYQQQQMVTLQADFKHTLFRPKGLKKL